MSKPKLILINGPLGAGKTTILKELLRQPTYKNARVIENEFASTSIDTAQLHEHTSEIQTIAGMCICCSTGDELADALQKLSTSSEPVIIEATGVANSLQLVEKIILSDMLERYDIGHAIFALDAAETLHALESTIQKYAAELKAADLVLITKTDLITTAQYEQLDTALSRIAIRNKIATSEGVFDTSILNTPSRILQYFSDTTHKITDHSEALNYSIIDTTSLMINENAVQPLHLVLMGDID